MTDRALSSSAGRFKFPAGDRSRSYKGSGSSSWHGAPCPNPVPIDVAVVVNAHLFTHPPTGVVVLVDRGKVTAGPVRRPR